MAALESRVCPCRAGCAALPGSHVSSGSPLLLGREHARCRWLLAIPRPQPPLREPGGDRTSSPGPVGCTGSWLGRDAVCGHSGVPGGDRFSMGPGFFFSGFQLEMAMEAMGGAAMKSNKTPGMGWISSHAGWKASAKPRVVGYFHTRATCSAVSIIIQWIGHWVWGCSACLHRQRRGAQKSRAKLGKSPSNSGKTCKRRVRGL